MMRVSLVLVSAEEEIILQIQNENSKQLSAALVSLFLWFSLHSLCFLKLQLFARDWILVKWKSFSREARVIPHSTREHVAPVLLSELLSLHKQPSPKP